MKPHAFGSFEQPLKKLSQARAIKLFGGLFMSASFMLKLITSPRYHLCNDALHARALAKQTKDDWNRGTYVGRAVATAWSLLEMCFRDALEDEKIGYRFKEDVNKAIANKGLSPIEWESGIWQKVLDLKKVRIRYTHINIPQNELLLDAKIADDAITVAREGAKAIYRHENSEAALYNNVFP